MSDSVLFMPGERIPVWIDEDADGNLPDPGQAVEVTGENTEATTVELLGTQGNVALGVVDSLESDEDGNAVAGMGTIICSKIIVPMPETTAGENAAGDEVMEDAGGGVTAFATATTPTTTPLGQVFSANAAKYGFFIGDDVAVALYR